MKRIYACLISVMLLVIGFLAMPSIAYAIPYESEAMGPNEELVPAPQVYTPERKIVIPYSDNSSTTSTFSSPEDMVYDEKTETIYVADTGNKRIVKLDFDGSNVTYINELNEVNGSMRTLQDPRGLSINDEYLAVADRGLQEVVLYDLDTLSYVKSITRPNSTLIGTNTPFVPTKVSIDNRGNVYVVSEGSTKGVMQLNMDGEFAGYIGANETPSSLLSVLQGIFGVSNDDQLLATGSSVTNIALDSKGLVYTVTNQSTTNVIKKLNTTGVAIMSPSVNLVNTTQICVDSSDNIYSVQSDGFITIFDSYGSLLFQFGGKSDEEILGALRGPVAVNVTSNHEILVLDREQAMIILYSPTHFANLVFEAVDYYKDGLYIEGEDAWLEVLKYNSKFILAYKALARASMKRGDYDLALNQFKLAEDKEGYSEAYWEIRDEWLRNNLGWCLLPILILVVVYAIYKLVDKKVPAVFAGAKKKVNYVKNTKITANLMYFSRFFKGTRDAVYEIKYKGKGSVIVATIMYLFFVVIQILQVYLKGYLFSTTNVYNSNSLEIILMSTLPLLLLVVCNYFVSTVSDGEGKFLQVYVSFIYALTPYLILAIPLFLISNVLTYNEQVVYTVLEVLIYGWCAINIILVIMELHDYNLWQTVKNILLTLVCFILVIAFAFILYLLAYQLFSYLYSIITELAR